MSKLFTVVGATGTQGSSVINAVLKDGSYRVRGLTRNPDSAKAKALVQQGVQVVKADINDEQSLVKAFEGSHAIFAFTDFFEPFSTYGPEKAMEVEVAQGINLANAASQTKTLEHYIWSTLPNGSRLTNGKYVVPHFAAKNRVDDYIKANEQLLPKTSFFWITWYANNYQYPIFTPNFIKSSGSYVHFSPAAPDVPVKSIGDPHANIGVFALAVVKQPELSLPGKFILVASEEATTGKLLQDWSDITGKASTYVQISLDQFSQIWPGWGLEMGVMMKMWDELRDKSWSGEDALITAQDLGLQNTPFASVKDGYARMDWDALL